MKQGVLKTIENSKHEFGSATLYPTVYIKHPNGEVKPYQFTEDDLVDARKRAIKNEADIPKLDVNLPAYTPYLIGVGIGILSYIIVVLITKV